MNLKKTYLINTALVFTSIIIALLIAEVTVLHFEKKLRKMNMPEPGKTEYIDLKSLNYNDTGLNAKKAPSDFRILCFGDSFCYSIMQPEHSYSGITQKYLNKSGEKYDFRVINLGEPASSMNDYMGAYAYWSKVMEYDGVVFNIYLGNDLLDIAYAYVPPFWTPNRYFQELDYNVADGKLRKIPRKFPLRLFDYIYAKYLMISKKKCQDSIADSIPGPEYNIVANDSNNLSTKVFRDHVVTQMDNFHPDKLEALIPAYITFYDFMNFISAIRKSGKKVALTLGPNEGQVNFNLRENLAEEYKLDLNEYDYKLSASIIKQIRNRVDPEIPILDMVEAFQSQYEFNSVNLYYKTNTHWGKEGNELAGLLIGSFLLTTWFNGNPILPEDLVNRWNKKISQYKPLLTEEEIETYIDTALNSRNGLFKQIDYVRNSYLLFDGIVNDPLKYASATLNSPMTFILNEPTKLKNMNIYLYDDDNRYYKFTVDCQLANAKWKNVLDCSVKGKTGKVPVKMPRRKISAFRITGLYNSDMKNNPDNKMIHIMEIELE